MDTAIPAGARYILRTLTGAGFEAELVGGGVRDLLRGVPPHDWDVCTSAPPQQAKAALGDIPTADTGLRHGTVTALTAGGPVEVTTFRREGDYADGRRPGAVTFDADLAGDLARRDFTVNAMAMDGAGEVTDRFGGRADLAA